MSKINVGILGSGNIGTDLLIKILRSKKLNCTIFAGRNLSSPGMHLAKKLGVNVTDKGIDAIVNCQDPCRIIFDATSAAAHKLNYPKLQKLGAFIIDMTPANMGELCVPSLSTNYLKNCNYINMITCGGQTAIPLAKAITNSFTVLPKYVETISTISSLSAGPGTRSSLDEYISTTELGLKTFTNVQKAKALINLNPANPPITMQTTLMISCEAPNMTLINKNVNDCIESIKSYVPGFQLIVPPVYDENRKCLITGVKVEGLGDYLPKYAGNLDIINCAALRVAENVSNRLNRI